MKVYDTSMSGSSGAQFSETCRVWTEDTCVVTLYGVFTSCSSTKGPSHSLLLELLDISVSELLVHSSQHGCSMWMTQHCARDVLEAVAFLHHKGYVHADLKPRNILWSAEQECFKLIDFGLSFKEGNQAHRAAAEQTPCRWIGTRTALLLAPTRAALSPERTRLDTDATCAATMRGEGAFRSPTTTKASALHPLAAH
ncbi:PREDICTED: serine/threonine-protein kinase Kist [Gekko japonicus]|uniref:Serine/threonine-protein kinase Kist n=1 Tax=Gekko japonicus TaxID=146911 RepID=A0ABM1K1A2_GEKJA|nr:PREDICTED: serine/threonine-protein kinase Kist [Gekko japonicus]